MGKLILRTSVTVNDALDDLSSIRYHVQDAWTVLAANQLHNAIYSTCVLLIILLSWLENLCWTKAVIAYHRNSSSEWLLSFAGKSGEEKTCETGYDPWH